VMVLWQSAPHHSAWLFWWWVDNVVGDNKQNR
jgi:hypothetical protein